MTLQRTPLYLECLQAGGRMVPFAGWEMPVQYTSLTEEHNAVRTKVGMFDISHMGIIRITGTNAKQDFQELIPSDIYKIGAGEAFYTVMLNKEGGILDDLIVYDLGRNNRDEECLLLIINAACAEKDLQ